ncbi:MAG: hypothetical protein LBH25_02590 [Fibromonadaceae bacterium]|jgi:hypothetical protein|nr:hypothetical protein [Fibromonadaceae bacterium]
MDKIAQAQGIIARTRPDIAENRTVYEAILGFYSDSALMETHISDLNYLLKNKVIKAYKANAVNFKDCALNLLESHPELVTAKGMLRFYEATPNFDWQECETAEIALGNALTMDSYGWQPDSWTVFKAQEAMPRLTVVAAF